MIPLSLRLSLGLVYPLPPVMLTLTLETTHHRRGGPDHKCWFSITASLCPFEPFPCPAPPFLPTLSHSLSPSLPLQPFHCDDASSQITALQSPYLVHLHLHHLLLPHGVQARSSSVLAISDLDDCPPLNQYLQYRAAERTQGGVKK
jgi:hypothetical protein